MSSLTDIRTRIIGIVRDSTGKLINPTDYDRIITAAINRYSKLKPAVKVADITGNGTNDYALPSGWIDEFSRIICIEYPIGDVPATLLDSPDDYEIYQSPTEKKIRLKNEVLTVSESFRVAFSIPRAVTTIPDNDVDALSNLASSFCLNELANVYAQSSDSTIGADSVDHKSKSQEYASRAKQQMKLYKEHIGIKDDDVTQAASAVIDLDVGYPGGSDRLTHQRRQRERR